jgi:hypothetical protein
VRRKSDRPASRFGHLHDVLPTSRLCPVICLEKLARRLLIHGNTTQISCPVPVPGGSRPVDKDLYELAPEEAAEIAQVPDSLPKVLGSLEADHA